MTVLTSVTSSQPAPSPTPIGAGQSALPATMPDMNRSLEQVDDVPDSEYADASAGDRSRRIDTYVLPEPGKVDLGNVRSAADVLETASLEPFDFMQALATALFQYDEIRSKSTAQKQRNLSLQVQMMFKQADTIRSAETARLVGGVLQGVGQIGGGLLEGAGTLRAGTELVAAKKLSAPDANGNGTNTASSGQKPTDQLGKESLQNNMVENDASGKSTTDTSSKQSVGVEKQPSGSGTGKDPQKARADEQQQVKADEERSSQENVDQQLRKVRKEADASNRESDESSKRDDDVKPTNAERQDGLAGKPADTPKSKPNGQEQESKEAAQRDMIWRETMARSDQYQAMGRAGGGILEGIGRASDAGGSFAGGTQNAKQRDEEAMAKSFEAVAGTSTDIAAQQQGGVDKAIEVLRAVQTALTESTKNAMGGRA